MKSFFESRVPFLRVALLTEVMPGLCKDDMYQEVMQTTLPKQCVLFGLQLRTYSLEKVCKWT